MVRKSKWIIQIIVALFILGNGMGWTATNNTGNNPCFLVIQACSDGFTNLSPDTIDIGIDIGADGTYDYWLSQDKGFNTEETRDSVAPENWRNIVIHLEQYAGKTAKIKIVDKSADNYIAVSSIRLNNADGKMVPNPVPNGFFDDPTNLKGWNLVEGGVGAFNLIVTDKDKALYTPSGTKFYNTAANGNQDKVVIESDAFQLTPLSSFIYGQFAGPASAKFDKSSAWESENGISVYIDLGTATQDPNGKYDDGVDIPLIGFLYDATRTQLDRLPLFGTIINTSGYEGRRAQIVIVDIDHNNAIAADSLRMNYDNSVIRNGGFEEGFENGLPDTVPVGTLDGSEAPLASLFNVNPAGKLPGWTQNKIPMLDGKVSTDPNDSFTYFSWPAVQWSRSDLAWVGSGSIPGDDTQYPEIAGVELRSDVFVIQSIPNASQNVFLSYNTLQSSSRMNADGQEKSVQLEVDVNNNNTFEEAADYSYRQVNQGSAWNREQYVSSGINAWAYPEYRFYIKPEHQGKNGRIFVTDTVTGSWGWMGVDDFYFWDGTSAKLAFPNSDFEVGDLTNWNEDLSSGTWLGGTQAKVDDGTVTHLVGDDHNTYIDGDFAASSAPDNLSGTLWSNPFVIPKATGTSVQNYFLYE